MHHAAAKRTIDSARVAHRDLITDATAYGVRDMGRFTRQANRVLAAIDFASDALPLTRHPLCLVAGTARGYADATVDAALAELATAMDAARAEIGSPITATGSN